MINIEETYIDDNHRLMGYLVEDKMEYYPEWRAKFFRSTITQWMGGWNTYTHQDSVSDIQGGKHTIRYSKKFSNKEIALDYLREHKIN